MIRIKPDPENSFHCPECRSAQTKINEILFESINIVADCICEKCGFEFYHIFPIGHTVDHPLSIEKKNGKLHHNGLHQHWVTEAVLKSHSENRKDPVNIEKIIFKKYKDIIILNTLDSLYGHVLLKLYNALHHLDHHPDKGLIVIVPKFAKWLIPKGCAEAWVVDLKLSELNYRYEGIQKYVSSEVDRFDNVYLSKAFSHPDASKIDFARLTGVKPFDLAHFSNLKPTITFVLREDRWWLTSRLDYWFYRTCRKINFLSKGSKILAIRQNRLVKKTINLIRQQVPEASFHIVGLGKTGSFNGLANDERQWNINSTIEEGWCRTYASSHVVIGFHGSNMLLPTALAAGCVEVLPEDRYENIIQDISVRYSDRRQLFFYRFADQFASPRTVSVKAVAMIKDYEQFNKNMQVNIYHNNDELVNSA